VVLTSAKCPAVRTVPGPESAVEESPLANHGRTAGQRTREIQDGSKPRGRDVVCAPELVEGTLTKGFGNLPRADKPAASRGLHDVPHFGSASLRGRQRSSCADHDEAELVAASESRIIVPTVFRNNYLAALKALSQNRITGAVVRTLDFAQRYTARWILRIWTGRGSFSIEHTLLWTRMRPIRGHSIVAACIRNSRGRRAVVARSVNGSSPFLLRTFMRT